MLIIRNLGDNKLQRVQIKKQTNRHIRTTKERIEQEQLKAQQKYFVLTSKNGTRELHTLENKLQRKITYV
jgi:hypothetical protein